MAGRPPTNATELRSPPSCWPARPARASLYETPRTAIGHFANRTNTSPFRVTSWTSAPASSSVANILIDSEEALWLAGAQTRTPGTSALPARTGLPVISSPAPAKAAARSAMSVSRSWRLAPVKVDSLRGDPWPASGRPARAGTGASRTPSAQCRFGHEHSGPAGADRRPP